VGSPTGVPDGVHGNTFCGVLPPEAVRGRKRDTVLPRSTGNTEVIPCNRKEVLVDRSSRCVHSKVGDTRLNVEGKK
jgi:hypothetical protein